MRLIIRGYQIDQISDWPTSAEFRSTFTENISLSFDRMTIDLIFSVNCHFTFKLTEKQANDSLFKI